MSIKLAIFLLTVAVQITSKTTLDGVYTAEQASRGEVAYLAKCSSCHREDLTGFNGPPLKGDMFMDHWREFNVNVLFDVIASTMPRGQERLSDSEYLDIQAYLLQQNGLPAGAKELTSESVRQTLLVGKDGPKPLPTSTPVDVVGCLTLFPGAGWFLTNAAEPARTMDQWELTPQESRAAKDKTLAGLRFRLQDIADAPGFNPDAFADNRIEVKGLLVRQPGNERVNVTAVQMIAPGCK
jgi:mono/diheme cytochrome c family protein